jgi:hypothetical protein
MLVFHDTRLSLSFLDMLVQIFRLTYLRVLLKSAIQKYVFRFLQLEFSHNLTLVMSLVEYFAFSNEDYCLLGCSAV